MASGPESLSKLVEHLNVAKPEALSEDALNALLEAYPEAFREFLKSAVRAREKAIKPE